MERILITGATGNIGLEVIQSLSGLGNSIQIIAGVRNIEKAKNTIKQINNLEFVTFDFENRNTFDAALANVDKVFLLRPPQIADVEKYIEPLISKIKDKKIKQIMFLSVQGAEKSKVIPHNKIERLLIEYGFSYIFIRPSYFMQNLTTTLLNDIQYKREIILPSGNAKFNWIDIKNIGEISALLLQNFEQYKNQAIELTGSENLNFQTVANLINETIASPIKFRNVNPFKFYKLKKKQGVEKGMIVVMILLHFLPRFQKEPMISDFYESLTGKKPTNLIEFITREKKKFEIDA